MNRGQGQRVRGKTGAEVGEIAPKLVIPEPISPLVTGADLVSHMERASPDGGNAWFMGRFQEEEFRSTLGFVVERNMDALAGFRENPGPDSAFGLFLWAPRLIRLVQFPGFSGDDEKMFFKAGLLNYWRAVFSSRTEEAGEMLDAFNSGLEELGALEQPAYERRDRVTWSCLAPATLGKYLDSFDRFFRGEGLGDEKFLLVPLLYGASRIGPYAESRNPNILSHPIEVINDVPTIGPAEREYLLKHAGDRVVVAVNEDNTYGHSLRAATEFVSELLDGRKVYPSSVVMNANTGYRSAFFAEAGFV